LTFKEVYEKNGWIINISVANSKRTNQGLLLNYKTTPDVVIWSACMASCSIPGVYNEQQLFTKTKKGELVHFFPEEVGCAYTFRDGSMWQDIPIDAMQQLFGVNTFIVSQVNPHAIPFIWNLTCPENAGFFRRLNSKLKNIAYHQISNFIKLISNFVQEYVLAMQRISEQTSKGHVVISPDIQPSDYKTVFSNVNEEQFKIC
jgi:TAG lipase / steryl ester hydrolase / phospholipase A2 / LPA acyltransferase